MTTALKEVERWLASPPWTPQFSMTGFARRHVGGNAGEGAVCGGVIGRSERAVKGCHQYRHRSCLDWPMMTATTETKDSQVVNNRGNWCMFGCAKECQTQTFGVI